MTEIINERFPQVARPDIVSGAALLYLALPIFIFFLGWFRAPWGLLCCGLTAAGLARPLSIAFAPSHQYRILTTRVYLILGLFAICWSALGGAGHFFYANLDWVTRDAVLRDLVISSWPPGYGLSDQSPVILRAPIAYYLPAAVVGSVFGLQFADSALWLWTALGTFIVLALLPLPTTLSLRLWVSLGTVILFSGMDVLGWLSFARKPLQSGQHIEWWASFFQYSSNTTQLYWVPNHALPSWIAITLFFRHWKNPSFSCFAPIVFALLPLWTPFAAIGMIPYYLLWFITQHKHVAWDKTTWLPAIAVLASTAPYLALDWSSVPASVPWASSGMAAGSFDVLLAFVLYEFLLLWILVWRKADAQLLLVTGAILLFLPLFRMGPGNDLVMRGSIPALMILCIFTIQAVQNFSGISRVKQIILAGVMFLGAVTPAQECIRAISKVRWSPNLSHSLYEAAGGTLPANYTARLNQCGIQAIFRVPSDLSATRGKR